MPIEKQVCSLELSQKLKELGVKQDSICHWARYDSNKWKLCYQFQTAVSAPFDFVAAFTVAELGNLIADVLDSGKDMHLPTELQFETITSLWNADYLANVAIHLIKNNLITL